MRIFYRSISLLFLFLTTAVPARATVISEPTCSIAAEILEIDRTQKYPAAKFRIISYAPIGPSGNCDFVALDQVITTNGGMSPESLQGERWFEAKAGYNLAMGPEGTVPFIQWQPITGTKKPMPQDFHLQSAAEQPVSTEKDKELKNFRSLLQAIGDKSIATYADKESITKVFGEPHSSLNYTKDGQNLERWTYRDPVSIGGVNLYFNEQNKLIRWNLSAQSSHYSSTGLDGI